MKDIITYKFGTPFGSSFIFSGYVMLLSGITITLLVAPGGLILSLIGAFIAFTHTKTQINTIALRIKHTQNLCGIFAVGKWVSIKPEMKLSIKKFSGSYTTYSRSNRKLRTPTEEYQLIICQQDRKECVPLLRSKNLQKLKKESETLAQKINLTIEN